MATVKTAISIDRSLFNEVEKLARQTHLSRSQIFSQAIKSIVKRKDNIVLLQRLNEVYGSGPVPEETARQKRIKRSAARLLKGTCTPRHFSR
jgi:hypothetical protein